MIAFGAALLASYQNVQAKIVKNKTAADPAVLFVNNVVDADTSYLTPEAKAMDGTTKESDTLKWEI